MERTRINEAAVNRMREMASASAVCMLITTDSTGGRNNRPMDAVKIDAAGDCWFFASRSSGKLKDMAANDKLQLVFANPGSDDYLEIHGAAEIVCDEKEIDAKWSPLVSDWFRGGARDPELCLVRITVTNVFYWDVTTENIQRLSITTTVVEAESMAA
jgi:general stress protein 26